MISLELATGIYILVSELMSKSASLAPKSASLAPKSALLAR